MTPEKLQKFLDVVKWKDSERNACDMCGRYARCRYCVRTEDYPCAMAHERLVRATSAPVPDHIPAWLIPEPDIPAQFDDAEEDAPSAQTEELGAEAQSAPQAAIAEESAVPEERLPDEGAAAPEGQVPEEGTARQPVLVRRPRGAVCLLRLQRRRAEAPVQTT